MKLIYQLLGYIRKHWIYAVLNIVFNVLAVIFSLFSLTMVIPFLQLLFDRTRLVHEPPQWKLNTDTVVQYFNYLITGIIEEKGEGRALLFISVLVIIMFFIKNLFRYLAMYFLAPLRNKVVQDLRNEIYHRILILPLAYFSEQRKGDIMSRITNDVSNVEWSIMQSLEMLFREPLAILFFFVTLIIISPTLTLFVTFLLPVTALLIARIGKSLKRTSVKGQIKLGVILSMVEETISGLRIIKGFNAIGVAYRNFMHQNAILTRIMNRLYRKRDLASPLSEFLSAVVLVVILYFGGRLVLKDNSDLEPSVFIFYVVVFSQLIVPVKAFTVAYYNVQKGIASLNRINEVLEADEVIVEKPDAAKISDFRYQIEYRNVSFAYQSEPVLKNIDLIIPRGHTIAIVGASGSGKSTLVDLLPRFYDCTSGDILIDGISIKDVRIDDLRSLMGIVTQETILFNDTVMNNIAFGLTEFNPEDVIEAARIAGAHEFIEKLPEGYQTSIGDRGVKLSGGQRQRISIARAVLRNPPILILDEATSSLDSESERQVQEALFQVMKNRTAIVIAHRISTIQFADEIIVLDKGEIAERGTHEELLQLKGIYYNLFTIQTFR